MKKGAPIQIERYWKFCWWQIPHNSVRKLLSTLPPSDSSMFRVDFRSSHVHYINNIEEDSMYKRWRSNLNEVRKYPILIFNILHVYLIFISPCFQLYCFASLRFYNKKNYWTCADFDAGFPWTVTLHSQEPFPCCFCYWSSYHMWPWGKFMSSRERRLLFVLLFCCWWFKWLKSCSQLKW